MVFGQCTGPSMRSGLSLLYSCSASMYLWVDEGFDASSWQQRSEPVSERAASDCDCDCNCG